MAHRVHAVGAAAPLADHLPDQLRRILQVSVDHHDDITGRVLEARRQRRLVSEVARQVNHAHARVLVGELIEDLGAAIGAAVVDEHELEVIVGSRRAGALNERLDELLRVVYGRDDTQEGGRAEGCLRHRRHGSLGVLRASNSILRDRPKLGMNLSFILSSDAHTALTCASEPLKA